MYSRQGMRRGSPAQNAPVAYPSTVRLSRSTPCTRASCRLASHARARAPPIHDADLALRAAGDAHAPPVENERVRPPGPPLARHERHHIPLDLHGLRLLGETEPRGAALHARVHNDSLVLPAPP